MRARGLHLSFTFAFRDIIRPSLRGQMTRRKTVRFPTITIIVNVVVSALRI